VFGAISGFEVAQQCIYESHSSVQMLSQMHYRLVGRPAEGERHARQRRLVERGDLGLPRAMPGEVDISVLAGAPEVAVDLLTRSGQFGMLHRSSI
jgi:hypothetical protein